MNAWSLMPLNQAYDEGLWWWFMMTLYQVFGKAC